MTPLHESAMRRGGSSIKGRQTAEGTGYGKRAENGSGEEKTSTQILGQESSEIRQEGCGEEIGRQGEASQKANFDETGGEKESGKESAGEKAGHDQAHSQEDDSQEIDSQKINSEQIGNQEVGGKTKSV